MPGPIEPIGDPARAFQVSASARDRYAIDSDLFTETGPLGLGDPEAAKRLAEAVNRVRDADRFPERAVSGSELLAAALVQEALWRRGGAAPRAALWRLLVVT